MKKNGFLVLLLTIVFLPVYVIIQLVKKYY